MGAPLAHSPVLLVLAVFSRHDDAFAWARAKAAAAWGPLALESPPFDFAETDYYQASMGAGLSLRLGACERLIDPAALPAIKRTTNSWEEEYRARAGHAEPRPLNLDPGYLTLAKLVLATTKDRDHRLYLGDGVFGEVTLHFARGAWQAREWTYPNYRRADYHQFLTACRDLLRRRLRDEA